MAKVYSSYAFLLLVLAVLFTKAAKTQDLLMNKISHETGLPASSVYRIIQDKNGYLWMATDQGVIRYNGTDFEHYSKVHGLSDNDVVVLKEGKDGKIWFFGYNGTASYWKKNKFYRAGNTDYLKKITTNYHFNDFYEDRLNRNFYFSIGRSVMHDFTTGETKHLSELDGCTMYYNWKDTLMVFRRKPETSKILINGSLYDYQPTYTPRKEAYPFRTQEGKLYFFSEDYLILQEGLAQKAVLKLTEILKKSKTLSITITKDGYLWIASQFGLFCYNVTALEQPPTSYLADHSLSTLFTDKEDNIWINSPGNGIIQITSSSRRVIYLNPKKKGKNISCLALHKLEDGSIVAGMEQGNWINWRPGKTTTPPFQKQEKTPESCYLIQSKDRQLWIGFPIEVIHRNLVTSEQHAVPVYQNGQRLKNISVLKSFTRSGDDFYFSGIHGLYKYHAGDHSKTNAEKLCNCYAESFYSTNLKIYSAFFSRDKALWMGTDSGLYVLKNKVTKSLTYIHPLLSERINCMAETLDSSLILGTNGAGLLVLKKGQFIQQALLNDETGGNFIKKIVAQNNLIYVLTFNGIHTFSYKEGRMVHTNSELTNLFKHKEINDFYVDDEEIGLAGNKGIYIIPSPSQVLKQLTPETFIERVVVQDSSYQPEQRLVLAHPIQSIRFQFASLYFQNPSCLNYRYRINSNAIWQQAKNNNLEITQMKPGVYRFEVEGRIADGPWSKPAVLLVEITPPFYLKWWFILICTLFASLLILLLVRWYFRIKMRRKEEAFKLKQRINELEQQALLTMMNPHFLFNVMNSIQSFINSNNLKEANQYLSDFAKLLRLNLDFSHKRFISLEEEISYLRLYIHFENLRLQKEIKLEVFVSPELEEEETRLPAMIIQPFVENSIWHGFQGIEKDNKISIEFHQAEESSLCIRVIDNGVGLPEFMLDESHFLQPKQAKGLSITIQRLCLLNQKTRPSQCIQFRNAFSENTRKGTCVSFILPS